MSVRAVAVALAALLSMALAPLAAIAGPITFVSVGNAGNSAISVGGVNHGRVTYEYRIATHEVTNSQYAEFLNAVADTDTFGLYHGSMSSHIRGGITRTGAAGSFSYSVKPGYDNLPVTFVSFADAARFANWMHNGKPSTGLQTAATTEDGAYLLSTAGVAVTNHTAITRKAGAQFFLPSRDEWFKAAYHDPTRTTTSKYWTYPTRSNAEPVPAYPGSSSPNTANIDLAQTDGVFSFDTFNTTLYLTNVGSYTASASFYGTFDQAGNVDEWTEQIESDGRVQRGGGFNGFGSHTSRGSFSAADAFAYEQDSVGFRIATLIPEPATLALLAPALALAWRRPRGEGK